MKAYVGPTGRLDGSLSAAEQEIVAAIQLRLQIRQVIEEIMLQNGQSPADDYLLFDRIIRRVIVRLTQAA